MAINLKDVTLVVVTSVKIEDNIKAMIQSMKGVNYGAVKFISHERPTKLPEGVEFVQCDKLSYDGFSNFTFKELYKFIDTSHSLLVHHDGFVSNPEFWDNSFLEYDYIGAPWRYSKDSYITDYGEHVRVGNAGFCLRSRRILELPTKLNLDLEARQGYYNDDGNFCVYHRKIFLQNNIKYAPIEIASKFSTETYIEGITQHNTFGFHGASNPKVQLLYGITL